MNPLSVFKTLQVMVPSPGGLGNLRSILEPETLFEESPPKSWTYRGGGKLFNGYLNGPQFLLIQKPMRGARFGTVVRGDYHEKKANIGEVELTSWVDPRAKRKLIFGYFLSVMLLARVIRDYYMGIPEVDTDRVLPYVLIVVLPITIYGTYLYEKARTEGFQTLVALFKSQS